MIIAVLFNSDHPSLGGWYGHPILQQIFKSQILQNANRHLKVGMGDLLFLSSAKNVDELKLLIQNTLFHSESSWLNKRKINDCVLNSTVFAWVIQNTTIDIAEQLHSFLLDFPSYLGIQEVDFSYPLHLLFFRNSIGEKYKIVGRTIRILCPMGELEDYGDAELKELIELGFLDADLEDSGAKLTIFDDYDSIDHFKRVDDFIKQISPYFDNGENDAYELCMLLNDINPKLFNSLGAAARTAKLVQNEEDVAQVAISGRRYLEQLADELFEPSEEEYNGHDVHKENYLNRIWAFIELSIKNNNGEEENIKIYGKKINRLVSIFNKSIHEESDLPEILEAFANLAKISLVLFTMQPIYSKDPYYAYTKKLDEFFTHIADGTRLQ